MINNKLFTLNEINEQQLYELFDIAQEMKEIGLDNLANNRFHQPSSMLVSTLFFEPSTRTHYSFCAAASKLGCSVMDINTNASSILKRETLYDTVKTLEMMHVNLAVIRHSQNAYYEVLQDDIRMPIVSGGDGTGNHPTQTLLDLFTIYLEYKRFKNLKALIVGDLRHSRVARTNFVWLQKLGVDVKLTGPEFFYDETYRDYMVRFDNLEHYDVILSLRYQSERHKEDYQVHDNKAFHEKWGLTQARYDSLQKTAIILHPGPVNRGVEIASSLVEAPKSRIHQQVENGTYIRAALIYLLLTKWNKAIV